MKEKGNVWKVGQLFLFSYFFQGIVFTFPILTLQQLNCWSTRSKALFILIVCICKNMTSTIKGKRKGRCYLWTYLETQEPLLHLFLSRGNQLNYLVIFSWINNTYRIKVYSWVGKRAVSVSYLHLIKTRTRYLSAKLSWHDLKVVLKVS